MVTSGAVTLSWIHGDDFAMVATLGVVGLKDGRGEESMLVTSRSNVGRMGRDAGEERDRKETEGIVR